ncbi:MAG TPA: AbrB/MazE/SpoVT family DNA-binding domain-containing protein [Allocoleopsis sp.]
MTSITLDPSGRVLIPQNIRHQLGLLPDSQLNLEIKDGKLILEPLPQDPNIINENGLLVIDAPCSNDLETIILDLRSERINQLSTW